jgi:hypothetical protein
MNILWHQSLGFQRFGKFLAPIGTGEVKHTGFADGCRDCNILPALIFLATP